MTLTPSNKPEDGVCSDDRAYFTLWLTKLEKALDERWETQQTALQAALASMDKRLDGMNEFRASLRDREAVSVTKSEFGQFINNTQKDLNDLKLLVSHGFTQNEHQAYVSAVDAKLQPLHDLKVLIDAKASQSQVTVATVLSVVSTLIAVIGLIIEIIRMASV